jgi:mannitol/fructose-specific phosphotransferase system IIA component (Ntr-type)
MIRISEILSPEQILLDVRAFTREEAIHAVAETLRRDERVKDWNQFLTSLNECDRRSRLNLELGITIPHSRTSSVTEMVMAFGRLTTPLSTSTGQLSYILVIGIPDTMDAEYLRLVGVLLRVFREEELRRRLDEAKTSAEVLKVFADGERSLGTR